MYGDQVYGEGGGGRRRRRRRQREPPEGGKGLDYYLSPSTTRMRTASTGRSAYARFWQTDPRRWSLTASSPSPPPSMTRRDAERRRQCTPCHAVLLCRSSGRSLGHRSIEARRGRRCATRCVPAVPPFPMCRLSFGTVSRNAARPLSSPRSPACLRRASPTSSGRRGLASIRPRARRLAAAAP